MTLQKSDYERLYSITKRRLNELAIDSDQFQEVNSLLQKLKIAIGKSSLSNGSDRVYTSRDMDYAYDQGVEYGKGITFPTHID